MYMYVELIELEDGEFQVEEGSSLSLSLSLSWISDKDLSIDVIFETSCTIRNGKALDSAVCRTISVVNASENNVRRRNVNDRSLKLEQPRGPLCFRQSPVHYYLHSIAGSFITLISTDGSETSRIHSDPLMDYPSGCSFVPGVGGESSFQPRIICTGQFCIIYSTKSLSSSEYLAR